MRWRTTKKDRQMRNTRPANNQGVALMELILAISVGVMVSLAATTVLLLCLRMHSSSNQTARHQRQVLTAITMMENLVADSESVTVANGVIYSGGSPLLKLNEDELVTAAGASILENVERFEADMLSQSLLSVSMTVDGQEYDFFILTTSTLELTQENGGAGLGVQVFLEILQSQLGSDGRIMVNGAPTNIHFASWYNPQWGEGTAWCSCYVSWALEQCRGYIQGTTPRYASVNAFKQGLIQRGGWINAATVTQSGAIQMTIPNAGDLIFFNWDGGELDHVGVVLSANANTITTLEGNSSNMVQTHVYPVGSRYIEGYGRINWIGN